MYVDPLGPESVPEHTQRNLTGLGLLCFLALVALGFRYDLLIRLFTIHPAVSVCAVCALLGLGVLALYGLGNSWRLLLRGRRTAPFGDIDLGWGGAMTHYGPADEDAFCGMQGGDGGMDGGGDAGGD